MYHLVEITLKKELFENINELRESRELLFEVLDEFNSSDSGGHIETDIDLDAGAGVDQFDNRYLKAEREIFSQDIVYRLKKNL